MVLLEFITTWKKMLSKNNIKIRKKYEKHLSRLTLSSGSQKDSTSLKIIETEKHHTFNDLQQSKSKYSCMVADKDQFCKKLGGIKRGYE